MPRNRAEHRHADLRTGLAEHLFVTGRADAIKDDAGQPDGGVERREAVQQRADALALAPRVDDQNHRRAEQTGDMRGRAARGHSAVLADAPVEQPHHAFHHGDVGAAAAVSVQRPDELLADQHRIEIAARPSAPPVCGNPGRCSRAPP